MPDQEISKTKELVDGLTDEELVILRKALLRAEWYLIKAVAGHLKALALIVASVLTVFGIASLSTFRSAAIEASANKLASDTDLRKSVITDLSHDLEGVDDVIMRSAELNKRLDIEEARAMRLIDSDLHKVLEMVYDIQTQIAAKKGLAGATQD